MNFLGDFLSPIYAIDFVRCLTLGFWYAYSSFRLIIDATFRIFNDTL